MFAFWHVSFVHNANYTIKLRKMGSSTSQEESSLFEPFYTSSTTTPVEKNIHFEKDITTLFIIMKSRVAYIVKEWEKTRPESAGLNPGGQYKNGRAARV